MAAQQAVQATLVQALADRFTDSPDFAGYELRLDDASGDAYRQLLRAYFDRELESRLKEDLHQALARVAIRRVPGFE